MVVFKCSSLPRFSALPRYTGLRPHTADLKRTSWDAANDANTVEVDGVPLSHYVSHLGMSKEDETSLLESVMDGAGNGDSNVGTSACTETTARVEIVTWNVGSVADGPGITDDIKREIRLLLGSAVGAGSRNRADVVVIGLQEVIPLSAGTALLGAPRSSLDHVLQYGWPEPVVQWVEVLRDAVNSGEHADRLRSATPRHAAGTQLYVLFGQPVYLFGLLLCVFCLPELVGTSISQFALFEMPADALASGVKGVVACRFSLFDRSFCFINCHFHAEKSNSKMMKRKDLEWRMAQITSCYKAIEFSMSDQLLYPLWAHRAVFLMGDTNMRLSTPAGFSSEHAYHKHVLKNLARGEHLSLLKDDQLLHELRRSTDRAKRGEVCTFDRTWREACSGGEGLPGFPPTFKLAVPGPGYSQKRIPAWTDRVLYRSREVTPVRYEALIQENVFTPPKNIADHNPVMAVFDVSCMRVSKGLLSQMASNIHTRALQLSGPHLHDFSQEEARHFRARFASTGKPHIEQLATRVFEEMASRLEGPQLTEAADWLIEHQQECWQQICYELEEQICESLGRWDAASSRGEAGDDLPTAMVKMLTLSRSVSRPSNGGRQVPQLSETSLPIRRRTLSSTSQPSGLLRSGSSESSISLAPHPIRGLSSPESASPGRSRRVHRELSCWQFLPKLLGKDSKVLL